VATKAALLKDLTLGQLQDLAARYDVQLNGSTKAEVVEELRTSTAVRVADIEAYIAEQEGQMAEEEQEETTAPSSASDDPVVAATADAEPGEDVEAPEEPPSPTTPIALREPEQAAAPGSQAPAVALAESDEAVEIDAQSGRVFRSSQGLLISDSAQGAAGSASAEEQPEAVLRGTWVRLGELTGDLEKYSGHEATVVEAPIAVVDNNDEEGFTTTGPKLTMGPDAVFTVRTRDQDSALLQITVEDVSEFSSIGRVGLSSAG
jgi:hypothetical protein